jgi:hypothetical protein
MSINQDSTTHNHVHGPGPASFNRSGLMSVDNSHFPNQRFGPVKVEHHSLTTGPMGNGTAEHYRSFQQPASGPAIKREVKFRWDNQQDCVQVDRKNDYKAYFLVTNLSNFPWKTGLTFVLQIGDDKREYVLGHEVKMQDDTKCEFDLRDLADKKPRDAKVEFFVAGSWTDPITKEKTKYFSERQAIGKLEFK